MHSKRYLITQAVSNRLQALATAQGASYQQNPALPLDSRFSGNKLLFVMPRGDKLTSQPGQREEKRLMRLVVGAFSTADGSESAADELHFAMRDMLKSELARAAMKAEGAVLVREVELEPELKDVATVGALLLSAYEIEYIQTYPSAA